MYKNNSLYNLINIYGIIKQKRTVSFSQIQPIQLLKGVFECSRFILLLQYFISYYVFILI